MGTIVRCERVSRWFGSTPAAVDVSFDVRQGEVFSLLGHNGAGKTTLIRLINGLLVPHRGVIETFGRDPSVDGHEVRRRTGVLTTYPGLDEYLSPAENLAVYAAIHGLSAAETRARSGRLLSRLGLDPASIAPARGLSAGLKQRVALARALIHEPDLLLLDEPTANLDPLAARDVRNLVREFASEGRTVIFSSHNLAEAEELGDRMAILQHGRLVAVGSLEEMAAGRLQRTVELRVASDQTEQAVRALGLAPNGQVSAHDGHIRIAGVSTSDVAGFVRSLVRNGVDVYAAVPRAPSLEDVYLAVHQQRTSS